MKLESLEARRLFDVNVIEGYPGFYEIHGSDGDDVIVAEINMAEESMTVDGTVYAGVAYVVAYAYGGDDYVSITSADGSGWIGASVDAGDGNDRVTLAVDGGVWAGEGNDQLYLLDSFRGEVYGQAGNDYMHVSGGCADAEIRGGDGHDYIDCSANFYGVVVFGGNGNDTIHGSALADQLHGENGNDVLDGGGGDDMFYAVGGGVDQLIGGDGNDVAYIDYNHDDAAGIEQVYAA
jgi:Ca2+-binding RTX toxin-like protein